MQKSLDCRPPHHRRTSRNFVLKTVALLAILFTASGVWLSSPVLAASPTTPAKIELTPEEQAEKEARKDCKIKLCAAFRLRKAGPDIACNVTKTWRKSQLDKLMSKARVSWPWGKVRCTAGISIKRQMILDAMTEPAYDMKLDEHAVSCTVDREKEPAEINFAFAPKVRFENGKAVKASLNWGKVQAPTLVKGVMWTAKTTDNTFNVLQSTVVEDINAFMTTRCDEVKSELATQ